MGTTGRPCSPWWGLPIPMVTYRELGILRRLSTTPVPPSWLLAAQVVVQLCVALAGLTIVVVTSVVAFGAPVPKSIVGLVLSFLLSTVGLFALGLLIAALARTASSLNVIGRLTLIPLLFFAGMWLPRALMPGPLLAISNYTPLGAAVEAIQDWMQTGCPVRRAAAGPGGLRGHPRRPRAPDGSVHLARRGRRRPVDRGDRPVGQLHRTEVIEPAAPVRAALLIG